MPSKLLSSRIVVIRLSLQEEIEKIADRRDLSEKLALPLLKTDPRLVLGEQTSRSIRDRRILGETSLERFWNTSTNKRVENGSIISAFEAEIVLDRSRGRRGLPARRERERMVRY